MVVVAVVVVLLSLEAATDADPSAAAAIAAVVVAVIGGNKQVSSVFSRPGVCLTSAQGDPSTNTFICFNGRRRRGKSGNLNTIDFFSTLKCSRPRMRTL